MQMRNLVLAAGAGLMIMGGAHAQETLSGQIDTSIGQIELENGYPSDSSVRRLYDEMDFQRAAQAYLWAMPIVATEGLRRGYLRYANAGFKVVVVNDTPDTPMLRALAGDSTSIHGLVFIDLGRDGPIVIELPMGVYGIVDDCWERPIVEAGPFGPDRGMGGKVLILPRGYNKAIPEGYFPAVSKTNRAVLFASMRPENSDVTAAVDTLARIRVYPLSLVNNPPINRVVRTGGRPIDTISPQGLKYWGFLSDALNHEPVEERDRFFHAMLKPLGIEKGKPFHPDERQRKILADAATVGFFMAQTISMAPRHTNAAYPATHWERVLTLDPNQEAPNYSQLDERTHYSFKAIMTAQSMIRPTIGAGLQIMSAAKDKNGAWLDGGKDYILHIPTNVPAKEMWTVTVYDVVTRSMISTDTMTAGISSKENPRPNLDGSIDIHFGPQPPRNSANWIKTSFGRGWFAFFRWFGPTEAYFDRSWTLPDIERAN